MSTTSNTLYAISIMCFSQILELSIDYQALAYANPPSGVLFIEQSEPLNPNNNLEKLNIAPDTQLPKSESHSIQSKMNHNKNFLAECKSIIRKSIQACQVLGINEVEIQANFGAPNKTQEKLDLFVDLAYGYIDNREFGNAKTIVNLGLRLDSSDSRLLSLNKTLENYTYTIILFPSFGYF